MPDLYTLVKFAHIALAIIGVGSSAGLGIWLELVPDTRKHEAYALRGIKFIEYRFVVPGLILVLATGLWMVYLAWDLTTARWLQLALALWLVAMLILAAYHPLLRRQILLAETGQLDAPAYARLARLGRLMGATAGLLVLAIVYLMVVKPA